MKHVFNYKNGNGGLFFIARPINKMNNKYLSNYGGKGGAKKLAKKRTMTKLRRYLKNDKLF